MGSTAEFIRHNDKEHIASTRNQQAGFSEQEQVQQTSLPGIVIQLQSTMGNQALAEMIDAGFFSKDKQAKASGAGKKMPAEVQKKMESSFQADFSDVEIHEDSKVATMGARAYAQSNQLFFAPGQYSPKSQSGQSLLGHELAHVVQQREGRVETPQGKGMPIVLNPRLETEADKAGERAARGLPALGSSSAGQSSRLNQAASLGAELNHEQQAPIQASFFKSLLGGVKKVGSAFIESGGLDMVKNMGTSFMEGGGFGNFGEAVKNAGSSFVESGGFEKLGGIAKSVGTSLLGEEKTNKIGGIASPLFAGAQKVGSAFVENGGLEMVGGALTGASSGYSDQAEERGGGGGVLGTLMKGVGFLGNLLGGSGNKKGKK